MQCQSGTFQGVQDKQPSSSSAACCGVLLQVREIAKVRSFYRDVLDIGDPVLDSTYYVEFSLPGGGLLILQQCDYAVEDTCGDTAWLLFTDHPEPIVQRLEAKGIVPMQPTRGVPGRKCFTYSDPEGNLFTIFTRDNGS